MKNIGNLLLKFIADGYSDDEDRAKCKAGDDAWVHRILVKELLKCKTDAAERKSLGGLTDYGIQLAAFDIWMDKQPNFDAAVKYMEAYHSEHFDCGAAMSEEIKNSIQQPPFKSFMHAMAGIICGQD